MRWRAAALTDNWSSWVCPQKISGSDIFGKIGMFKRRLKRLTGNDVGRKAINSECALIRIGNCLPK